MSMDATTAALIRRAPWTNAQPGSMWEATGTYPGSRDRFQDCLITCVPPIITGTDTPIFTVLVHGDEGRLVPASSITTARELILVSADDPTRAYYLRDQDLLDDRLKEARDA